MRSTANNIQGEDLKLDSHKLLYHVGRLQRWLKDGDVFPLYLEVGIFGGCNHRCIFCAFDFLKYEPSFLEKEVLQKFFRQAAKAGTKAVLFSGEGEPLLHKDFASVLVFTKAQGIDTALVTNGVFLDKKISSRILKHLSWLKISLDAGSAKTYSLIHGTGSRDFKTVLSNLKEAVKIRNNYRSSCIIGVQSLLLPQNIEEMGALAGAVKKAGADYLVVKPFSPHGASKNKIRFDLKSFRLEALEKELAGYSGPAFKAVLRRQAIAKLKAQKPYRQCLGLPFAAHLCATGEIYPCNAFVGKEKYSFGNIRRESFKEIWSGARRKRVMSAVGRLNPERCRKSCRLDEINRYLWDLRHPGRHVNFI
jgi:GTP 3',8-cyclase